MERSQPLSRRGAILVGVVCIAAGCPPILMTTGLMRSTLSPGVPWWVGLAAGLVFICGGAAVIVGHAVAGGVGPDGDLPPGTPLPVRATQYLLGFLIVGLLLAISSWVAFGPGERHFSTTAETPFGVTSTASSEPTGRIVFGAGAIVIGIFWVYATMVSVRRLKQAAKRPPPSIPPAADRAPRRGSARV
jgi:hypothetical protein